MAILDYLGQPIKSKPVMQELVHVNASWMLNDLLRILPDPDLILRRTGKTYEIFDEMENDSHIWANVTARKAGVKSKRWDIKPAGTEPKDCEIAKFVKDNLLKLDMFKIMGQMLDAIFRGINGHEIIWQELNGKWLVKELKNKGQKPFVFSPDGTLKYRNYYTGYMPEDLPERKIVLVRHEDKGEENPYGTRVFSKCYWSWVFKKNGWKFWAIYCEKYGMPHALGKYPSGLSKEERDLFINALSEIILDSVTAVEKSMDLELIEPKNANGGLVHKEFLESANKEISKAILGQTLTTEVGDNGSYAASKTHENVKNEIIEADAEMIMGAINTELIPWLVDYNFGVQNNYPKFVINYDEQSVKKELAERDCNLLDRGLAIPVDYLYKTYNIPKPTADDDVLQVTKNFNPVASFREKTLQEIDFAETDTRQGVLDNLLNRGLEEGLKLYRLLTADLENQIEAADELSELQGLDYKQQKIIEHLGELMKNLALNSYLYGRYCVNQDLKEEMNFADYVLELNPLPFEQAISFFQALMPINKEDYLELNDILKQKYFTIADVESQDVLVKVKESLDKALAEGETFDLWKKGVEQIFKAAGVEKRDPWKLEVSFRNNIQTAHHAGQWEQLHDPDVEEMFPFYQYHAINDRRVRPDHLAMDGMIFPSDDDIWEEWWPPNGHACRCTVTAINKYKAARMQLKKEYSEGVPEPDKGFNVNPSKALRSLPDSIARRK